ncbi:hypothetical protein DX933_17235 [Ornithinibacillus gellani]|uniref:hypothetical protein n=1 Tax=Ornithinibacillus gellani TaxID=2293253 RepID=UPI000F4841D5|nr:hypothetical protein [Ornithinibacillus gellani]TQS71093.1 hypothetical protein DX933_17235 [Ornithinibacillus gellani]
MNVSPWKNTSAAFKAQIIGKLLGDGCITIQQGRKPRFQFIHTSADFAWSNYCFHQFKKEIPLNPPKFRKIFDNRSVKGFSTSHYTQSRTSPIISYLRKQWYSNNRKEIPSSLLYTYFIRQSLAWWYMDDGHLKIVNGIPTKIILSTESFSEQENMLLIAFLEQKYGLVFKTDKQNRIILYDQFQIRYFLFLINPYMQTCMYRKTITTFYREFDT